MEAMTSIGGERSSTGGIQEEFRQPPGRFGCLLREVGLGGLKDSMIL